MGEKKDELSEKDLEQAAGGASRRDVASDQRLRNRAAPLGHDPAENSLGGNLIHCATPRS